MPITIEKLNKIPFYKEQKGITTLEFALVMIPFLMLILFTMELSRVIFLYASIDLSLSEASQRTAFSTSSGAVTDYKEAFSDAFTKNIQTLPLLSKDDTINVNVSYCANIDQIINNTCSTDPASKASPLALYSVVYDYRPVFFIFPDKFVEKSLTRNLVYVQEYERAL